MRIGREAPDGPQLVGERQVRERNPLRGPGPRHITGMARERVGHRVALRLHEGKLVERPGDMLVARNRPERGQHCERVGDAFVAGVQADLRRDGWRPTTGAKDSARKLHPLLDVPWEELDEINRDRDRDPIRLLPAMLLAVGLEVRSRNASPDGGDPVDRAAQAGLGSTGQPA